MNTCSSNKENLSGIVFFLILFIILVMSNSRVYAVEEVGSYTLDYGSFLGGKERKEAEVKALQNVIERWVAEKNPSHFQNYERVKDEINENVRDYILDYVASEDRDRNAKTFRVMVRGEINEPKLLRMLLSASESSALQQQYITLVFVARELVGAESRSTKESEIYREQDQSIGKERLDDEASQRKTQGQTIRRNDSEINYKDRAIWDVTTTNDIDSALGKVFVEADYLVVDAALLEEETDNLLRVESFINDYKVGSDISSQTRRDSLRGLQSLAVDPVRFLAIGTLDVDEETVDKQTGNIKVAVAVTGQVIDVDRRGAVVAKVGPETTIGEGPTFLVAKNNALKLAAEQVAGQLVAQLSSRNIR